MKQHAPHMLKPLIILSSLILAVSFGLVIWVPAASAEEQMPPMADSATNGLGVQPFSPNRTFGDDEAINTENGNLHLIMTDITLPGRGIPLRITRVYNSQWNRPIFFGLVRVTDYSDQKDWNGRIYANDDPNNLRPAGLEINYATYYLSSKTAFQYLLDMALGAGGGFLQGGMIGALWGAAISGFKTIVDLATGDIAYWTNMLMLSGPKQELGINEVYAIVGSNDGNSESVAVSADASAPAHPRTKIKLILTDGSMLSFNAREYFGFFSASDSGEGPLFFDSVEGLSNYRVMYDYQLGKYLVTTPAGVTYYLQPYRDEIKNDGIKERFSFYTKYERVDLFYALPVSIEDPEKNWIEIRRNLSSPHNITSVLDTLGREVKITRQGNTETLVLPGDRKIVYTYDSNNNITSIKDPEGRVTTYVYESQNFSIPNALDFNKAYSYLSKVIYPTGGGLRYEGLDVVMARHEFPDASDENNRFTTTFSYERNPNQSNPSMLYQRTIVTDPEGNRQYFVFYAREKEVVVSRERVRHETTNEKTGETTVYYTDEERKEKEIYYQHTRRIDAYSDYNVFNDYEWDDNRRLKTVTISQENDSARTSFEYDLYGNPTKVVNPFGHVVNTEYYYLTTGGKYLVHLPKHKVENNGSQVVESWYDYDIHPDTGTSSANPTGRLSRIRQAVTKNVGGVKTRTVLTSQRLYYDQYGNVKEIKDAKNTSTFTEYDPIYRIYPIATKNAINGRELVARKGYDPATGNVLWEDDLNGNQTRYEYDKLDRLTKKNYPDGSHERYVYQTKSIDGINQKVTIRYDAVAKRSYETIEVLNGLGWVVESKEKRDDGSYLTTRYGYNKNGRKEREVDPLDRTTYFTYDSLGRTSMIIHPDGSFRDTDYDYIAFTIPGLPGLANAETFLALEKKVIDANYHTTRYIYDTLGQLRHVEQKAGEQLYRTYYYYDELGKLKYVKDARGLITQNFYDELGRLTETIYPDGSWETNIYDDVGNLIAATTANGVTISYVYDDLKRLVAIDYPGTTYDVAYGYDESTTNGLGNKTSVKDPSGTRRYFYDSRNRATKEVREIAAPGVGGGTMTVEYSYFGLGATRQITYPNGKKLLYEYDDLMRLAAVKMDSDAAPALVSYAYNLDGTLKTKAYANGVITSYSYDLAKRPDLLETVGKDKALLFRQDYDYDPVGNRTRLTGTYGEITNYEYDGLDRLTKVQYLGGKSTTYSYDPNSNRIQMAYPFGNVTYRYDNDSDQLLSTQSGSQSRVEYVYDQNGSLSREKQLFGKEVVREIAYNYDPEARLIEIVLDANTNQPARVTYTYDDRGLRVVKNTGEESTIYITNLGNQVLYELDGAGKAKNTYFFANGEQIAQLDPAGKTLYLHNDLLGSPGIITNEAGEVVQRYTYEPFGSIIASEGGVDNPYTFTGKEYDEEAGLYYYGARYYSPLSGRFITFDTVAGELETPISQNQYIYAWANPLRYTDPDGHVIEDIIGIGFDLFDLATSPSWWDAAFLVADIGALFIPGVPGPGTVKAGVSIAKGLKRGEKAVDAAVDVGKAVKVGKAAEEAIKSGRFSAFKSFEAFKRAMGSAGEGMDWHHVVEQSKVEQFGAETINNAVNVIKVPKWLNKAANALYSSKNFRITGSETQTVRQWLNGKSFEFQYEFGLKALEMIQKGLW